GGAGFFLQRGAVHLRTDPAAVLQRPPEVSGILSASARAGKLSRSAADRPALRYGGAASYDLPHLRRVRRAAGRERLDVRTPPADGTDPGARLERDLLHRIVGSEFGLPDGERDFPAGDPRAGHRHLLRVRDAGGRGRRARTFRIFERDGIARQPVL